MKDPGTGCSDGGVRIFLCMLQFLLEMGGQNSPQNNFWVDIFNPLALFARAVGAPVSRRSVGRRETTLVAAINVTNIFHFFPFSII